MNRQEYTKWAVDQINKYGIRHPDTYTEKEIKEYCPTVPHGFIKKHVKKRDKADIDDILD